MSITTAAKVLVTIVLGGVTAVIAIPADAQTTTTEDTTTVESTTTITTTTFLIIVDRGCNPPPGKPRGLCSDPPVTTPTTPPAGHGSKPRLKSLYPSG